MSSSPFVRVPCLPATEWRCTLLTVVTLCALQKSLSWSSLHSVARTEASRSLARLASTPTMSGRRCGFRRHGGPRSPRAYTPARSAATHHVPIWQPGKTEVRRAHAQLEVPRRPRTPLRCQVWNRVERLHFHGVLACEKRGLPLLCTVTTSTSNTTADTGPCWNISALVTIPATRFSPVMVVSCNRRGTTLQAHRHRLQRTAPRRRDRHLSRPG